MQPALRERAQRRRRLLADHAIDPRRFHWQSQSGTRASDAKGLRHVEHRKRGITPLSFVRATAKDERGERLPYRFLGPLSLRGWHGGRPMNVEWELQVDMPAEVLKLAAVVA